MRVLIAGGGIGGLTLAAGLSRTEIDYEVYERTYSFEGAGSAIGIAPNALAALDCIGLAEQVIEVGDPVGPFEYQNWRGRVLFSTDIGDFAKRYGFPALAIHRSDLHDVLRSVVDPSRIHHGTPITGYRQTPQAIVAVAEDRSEIWGDVLVGADGIRSRVRAQFLGDGEAPFRGRWHFRAMVKSGSVPHVTPFVAMGRGAKFGYTDGKKKGLWFAHIRMSREQSFEDGTRNHLLRFFDGWSPAIRSILEATPEEEIYRGPMRSRPASRRWGEGRMTLLGDAAHAMVSDLGQGGCQAIEDAATLTYCLQTHEDPVAAFRSYEKMRRRRANKVLRRSRQTGATIMIRNSLLGSLRNTLIRMTPEWLLHRRTRWLLGHRPPAVQGQGSSESSSSSRP